MPFAPFPTPDDILAAGRLSHIPLPLSGATLSGLVIQNNRVQFSDNESLTSGTATFCITPAQLAQWKQLITYVKLNTNNSATYTIKDTSGNTITGPTDLANGLNIIDISSLISAELYKAVDVVITLSRESATDASPELHYVAVLIDGQSEPKTPVISDWVAGIDGTVTVYERTSGRGTITGVNFYQNYSNKTSYFKIYANGKYIGLIYATYYSTENNDALCYCLNIPYENGFKVELVSSSTPCAASVSFLKEADG